MCHLRMVPNVPRWFSGVMKQCFSTKKCPNFEANFLFGFGIQTEFFQFFRPSGFFQRNIQVFSPSCHFDSQSHAYPLSNVFLFYTADLCVLKLGNLGKGDYPANPQSVLFLRNPPIQCEMILTFFPIQSRSKMAAESRWSEHWKWLGFWRTGSGFWLAGAAAAAMDGAATVIDGIDRIEYLLWKSALTHLKLFCAS